MESQTCDLCGNTELGRPVGEGFVCFLCSPQGAMAFREGLDAAGFFSRVVSQAGLTVVMDILNGPKLERLVVRNDGPTAMWKIETVTNGKRCNLFGTYFLSPAALAFLAAWAKRH